MGTIAACKQIIKTTGLAAVLAVFMAPAIGSSLVSAAPSFTEYPTESGSTPFGFVNGPDGAIWFTEINTSKIGRISTSGSLTEYAIPTPNASPQDITVGSDGALWFTETGSKIGRITTSGVVTEFNLPIATANYGANQIVNGPDGALWFTESNVGGIGRMTTAGVYSQYNLPPVNAAGITVGPDGALWFTESGGNKIGRLTTSLALSEYSVPTAGSRPNAIVTGPDGALWFTELFGNKIGRITTAGAVNEYATQANALPLDITNGPDGALWFTELNANTIGRITTAGSVNEYLLPNANSSPTGITTGSDGALWFGEETDNVGRAALPPVAPVVHITNPTAQSTASGTVNITGSIASGSAYNLMLYVFNSSSQAVVSKYQYAVPAATTTSSYSWDTTAVPNGTYTIVLSAKDAQGNKDANSTATLKVTVQN